MLNDLAARALAFRELAATVLEAEFGIPRAHRGHVDDITAAALAAKPGPCLQAETEADVRANLVQLHADDPDQFLGDRGWRFAARTIAASVGSSDIRSWESSCHFGTADERRKLVYAARARLRAEGRPVPPAPELPEDGGKFVSDDRLAR